MRDQIDFVFTLTGSSYTNIDRVRARGVEVETDWAPVSWLGLFAQYNFVEAIDRSTGLQLVRQAKHSGSAQIDLRPVDKLAFGARLVVNGDKLDVPAPTDSYARLDLLGSYDLTDKVQIFARVENVTDTDYEDISGYSTAPRSAYGGVRLTW